MSAVILPFPQRLTRPPQHLAERWTIRHLPLVVAALDLLKAEETASHLTAVAEALRTTMRHEREPSLGSLDRALNQERWSECCCPFNGGNDLELDRSDFEDGGGREPYAVPLVLDEVRP